MMQAARDAGAAKRLDEDVERASQAATPELALCEQASPKRLKARSKTFDLGSVCVHVVALLINASSPGAAASTCMWP